ncbi:transcription factor FapR [Jeotgalibacillus proteolyticus]|uniref:Transcription factor FapR n=1 Tax=Jeotgalibacillus proteolyticus TaxID=2082395 RepID=A0A2S5GGH2_9BACL|nr:transcription factor FapR [Jeotgalibacillus proteolyticus]PPA72089.1 transcription factor FapR [Jeotgalibacillus proteolyticus]
MKLSKKDRQTALQKTIEDNPFVTDDDLAKRFNVSVQTIRLDRMELSIPELRERIKSVAEQTFEDEVRSLPIDEVIGEIIDIELDNSAISIFDVKQEHVFQRNRIMRGHHLFAQANSLAVAVINDELALTASASITFSKPVQLGERVIAKAKVSNRDDYRTTVEVNSYVDQALVFKGSFDMYRSTEQLKEENI